MDKKILGLALAATLSSGVAQADIFSYTETSNSYGVQGSSTDFSIGTLNNTVTVAGFNNILGTLVGVNITAFSQIDSSGSSQNNSIANGSAAVAVSLFQDWKVSSASATTHTFEAANFITPLLADNSGGPGSLLPSETFNYAESTGERNGVMGGANFADFMAGSVDFLFQAFAQTVMTNVVESGTGFFTNSISTGSWGEVVVEYVYDDGHRTVPEPASLALMGLGLSLVGFARRKKQA